MTEQRVFMAYSQGDRRLLQSALKWLRESELRSAEIDDPANWSPRRKNVRSLIREKIGRANAVVVIWSDRAAKSAWVNYEIGMADALGVPIRVLSGGASPAKLPAGLDQSEIIRLEPVPPAQTLFPRRRPNTPRNKIA
jgi:hypothetical protein